MRQVLAAILAVIVLPTTGLARSLSLSEIFDVSKQKVESLAQQKAQVDFSRAQLQQVTSNFYPVVGGFFSYTRQDNPLIGPAGSPTSAFTNPDQILTKLSATYTGLQGFREIAAYRSAKSSLRAQEASLRTVEVNLYAQVAQAYYGFLSARKDLKNLRELLKLSEARTNEVQRFVSLGRSREADLLSQETQVATLRAQVHQADQTVKLDDDALRILTGLDPEDDIAENQAELPGSLEPLDEMLKKIEERSDIRALKAQVDAAEETINVALGGHLPTLGLFADYYPYRTGILQPVHWDLGLSVTIPLFQGFGVDAQVQQYRATARTQRYAFLQAERDAQRQIRSNYDALKSVLETLPLFKKALDVSKKNYDQQQLDYSRKLNTDLDVNTALTQYATLMRTYDQTWYQGKAALEALNASIGNLP